MAGFQSGISTEILLFQAQRMVLVDQVPEDPNLAAGSVDGRRRTEDRRPKTEDASLAAGGEDSRPKTEDRGRRDTGPGQEQPCRGDITQGWATPNLTNCQQCKALKGRNPERAIHEENACENV